MEKRQSLQNLLTYNIQEARMKLMKTLLSSNENMFSDLRWWNGLCNNHAGAWLDAIPKLPSLSCEAPTSALH